MSNKSWDSPSQSVPKEVIAPSPNKDTATGKETAAASNVDSADSKGALVKVAADKSKDSRKSGDKSKNASIEGGAKEEPASKLKHEHRMETSGERNKDRDRDREREKGERQRSRDRDRGKDSDREREYDQEKDGDRVKDRTYRTSDKGNDSGGYAEKLKHSSAQDRDYHDSSYSRDKKRQRQH